jgi:hypothetical protein
MQRKIVIEGTLTEISLNNLGAIQNLDYDIEGLSDEAEIAEFMQELETLVESGDVESVGNQCKYKVIPSEEIEYLACADEDAQEKEISLDRFTLVNKQLQEMQEFIEQSVVGDIIYLRKEQGKATYELSLEVESSDAKMQIEYFDCSESLDSYDILRESYFESVCDTLLPESISTKEQRCIVENYLFEPQMIFGEIYKVIEVDGVKTLDRVEIPGYYYKDETESVDS